MDRAIIRPINSSHLLTQKLSSSFSSSICDFACSHHASIRYLPQLNEAYHIATFPLKDIHYLWPYPILWFLSFPQIINTHALSSNIYYYLLYLLFIQSLILMFNHIESHIKSGIHIEQRAQIYPLNVQNNDGSIHLSFSCGIKLKK